MKTTVGISVQMIFASLQSVQEEEHGKNYEEKLNTIRKGENAKEM